MKIKQKITPQRLLSYALFLCLLCFLAVGILEPIKQLVLRSISNHDGDFIGLSNFYDYFANKGLVTALVNSILISLAVTACSLLFAFLIAYGLCRTQLFAGSSLQALIQLPLFVPSIFPCLGLIYLFGSQGIFIEYLGNFEIYGPIGVFLGGVIFTLPHAILLLTTTLRGIDPRLYQAASSLGAGAWRQFMTVTLPNCSYGLISAGLVIFTLTMTDFGIAKVLAGRYPMLATEIYKQVIGQQNFSMGATISLILIVPMCLAFTVDSWARKKQSRLTNNMTYRPVNKAPVRDLCFSLLAWLPCLAILTVIGTVVWGAFVTYWPYDFSPTLANFDFEAFGYGWQPYWNSLLLATSVATFGLLIVYISSYLTLRADQSTLLIAIFRFMALLPMSIPGTVLGLAYIFAFNRPDSLLSGLYGTLAILVFNTIIHLFSVSFMTCSSALSRLDRNYERVGSSLQVAQWVTFFRVIVPLTRFTLLDVFFYLFVNALTTISAVVFLYNTNTVLASVVILNMDDAGDLAAASAMGTLLLATALLMKIIHIFIIKYYR